MYNLINLYEGIGYFIVLTHSAISVGVEAHIRCRLYAEVTERRPTHREE
jgi:hypothetical protein